MCMEIFVLRSAYNIACSMKRKKFFRMLSTRAVREMFHKEVVKKSLL